MSLVFLVVYLSSRSIWLHHPVISSFVVLIASFVKGLALVLVSAVFLGVDGLWAGAIRYIFLEALVAAVLAPLVFDLLRRGQKFVERVSVPTD
jgi:hypothetical protein